MLFSFVCREHSWPGLRESQQDLEKLECKFAKLVRNCFNLLFHVFAQGLDEPSCRQQNLVRDTFLVD